MKPGAVHNRSPDIPETKNVLDNNNKTRPGRPKQIETERV